MIMTRTADSRHSASTRMAGTPNCFSSLDQNVVKEEVCTRKGAYNRCMRFIKSCIRDFYSGLCLDDYDKDRGLSPFGIYPDGRYP